MKYLVLHTFRSFGRTLRKGGVVDESAIRSLRLRMSERKIVPAIEEPTESAVISSGASVQQVVAAPAVQVAPPNESNKAHKEPPKPSREEDVAPIRLSFSS